MAQKHTNLLKRIMLKAPANVRLFRNDQGYVESIHGEKFRYGFGEGTPDLIGYSVIRGVAVFTAVEGKIPPDKESDEQTKWREHVVSQGGVAIVARSVEECWELHSKACKEVATNIQGSGVPYGSFPEERAGAGNSETAGRGR